MPRGAVEAILRAARNCPSTNNTQPWSTIVAQGDTRDALAKAMLAKFDAGDQLGHVHSPRSPAYNVFI